MHSTDFSDTIIALATPQGVGALATIRLSGGKSISTVNSVFKGKDLAQANSHTLHFGTIRDEDRIIDEVLISVFKGTNSFTKEESIEISCHGSMLIVKEIIKLLITKGVRLAKPGEFTQRAFLHGKFDLAQAEAVADLIHAGSEAARKTALDQMRGGFSKEIKQLRKELIHFASMIELELDFGEEDVEFANRDELKGLIEQLLAKINALISSFDAGNVIKNGVPTVIAGKPNAGKSTLLNALLKEDKAIVSEIAGTTRDTIEDEINLGGVSFRFIDTAGLRDTTDTIEAMGVKRTKEQMEKAGLILYMIDLANESVNDISKAINTLKKQAIPYLLIGNKADLCSKKQINELKGFDINFLSAKLGDGLKELEDIILEKVNAKALQTNNTVVTNLRHQQQLLLTKESLEAVIAGIDNSITNDFVAQDIRHSLHHLGEITGEISTDDLLENIFRKFCIGK
ncbi:tRNA-5-carboxymethylaminomethyl-2-thiouridine(34)synthesis protein MnmE [hydrothermal vent metagenome]|uniref:tRNA-5-carboxymethylaminomethyl-2-thiouridine(34) synthesis protein MnmE n=1 Tax=hydrothermal vent metagenome TaxID=652676 RepID=A0A3B0U8F7_9ZZZZ